MATAAAVALSALTNRSIRTSHNLQDIQSSHYNVVHVQRPSVAAAVPHGHRPTQLLAKPGVQAIIDVSKPAAASEYLLSAVLQPDLQQQLQQDLSQAVQLVSSTLQLDHVHAKLQIIEQQSCPNWHADTVGMRLLCTYAGPGTWYIANKFVRRKYNPLTGDVAVAGVVDEAHAVQTAVGDLLFLKGNAFPGLFGAGAVHKSPELEEGAARLLLTVDDACC